MNPECSRTFRKIGLQPHKKNQKKPTPLTLSNQKKMEKAIASTKSWSSYKNEWQESIWVGSKVGPHLDNFYRIRWLATYPLQMSVHLLESSSTIVNACRSFFSSQTQTLFLSSLLSFFLLVFIIIVIVLLSFHGGEFLLVF